MTALALLTALVVGQPPETTGLASDLTSQIEVNGTVASEENPVPITIGQLVRLSAKESGVVRERIWKVEPAGGDIAFSDDRSQAFFSSPLPGVYTIHCVSVAETRGVAWATAKIELGRGNTNGFSKQAQQSPIAQSTAPERQNAPAFVRQALQSVDIISRAHAPMVANVFRGANTLNQAESLCRQELAGEFAAWQPFFSEMRRLFQALEQQGYLATPANVRGALTSVAILLEREKP